MPYYHSYIRPRYAWVGGAAFLLGGVFFLTLASGPIRDVERARSWVAVQGRLGSVHLGCEAVRQVQRCYPRVQYEYRLPDPQMTPQGIRDTGRVYIGTRITFANFALLSDVDHDLILARYHAGAPVRVYHDPRARWNAVLERRAPVPMQIWWIGGLLFGGGALVLILALRQRHAVIKRWRRRAPRGSERAA